MRAETSETLAQHPPDGESSTPRERTDERIVSVVVPVYNEKRTLRRLVERVLDLPIVRELIVVDDGSTDGSGAVADELAAEHAGRVRVIHHGENRGKGAAVRSAVPEITAPLAVIQDADLEYDPRDLPRLARPILEGRADVVYGSRFLGEERRVLMFWHALGNKVLTGVSNALTNLNLTDMETGYKMCRTSVLRRIHIRSDRFGLEPELTAKFSKMGCRIYEVPIAYHGRTYAQGKKIRWWDGLDALQTVVRYTSRDDLENTDPGYKTLQRMRRLRRYNAWLWLKIAPFVGERVLEVGSGIGNMTRFLLDHERVIASDIREEYRSFLRNAFEDEQHVSIVDLDITAYDPADLNAERLDTILCLNVLEHIEDDEAVLARFRATLETEGRVILLVPAMRALYGDLDRALGHYRRYRRAELESLMRRSGLEPEHVEYLNVPGALGWFLNSRLLHRRTVPGLQAYVNNLLVPLLRFEEHFTPSVGLSLLAVGRKLES